MWLDSIVMSSFAWWKESEDRLAFGLCLVYWLLLSSRAPVKESTNEAKEDRCVSLVGNRMSLKGQAR